MKNGEMMLVADIRYCYTNKNRCQYMQKQPRFGASTLLFDNINEYIFNDDINKIKTLPDLYIVNKKQENLLHTSAKFNKYEISKYLLYKNLNPNQKNLHGKTPFAIAAAHGDKDLVSLFLLHGAKVNTKDELQNTPLHQCWNKPDVTELLLRYHANPYAVNEFDKTPVYLALKNLKSLEVYLNNGINPNLANSKNQSLLHSAIIQNNLEAADVLKKYRAEVNYKDASGRSAIFYAKMPESIKWLVKNKANINLQDNNKQTALHLRVINNDANIVNLLLKYKADANIFDNNNLPPLGYAKTLKMMKLLLDNGAAPDVITPKGSTVLHNSVKTSNVEAVYLLLKAGANPNILDKDLKIPLDYAANNDVFALLLGFGANPNYKNYLKQALLSKNYENLSNLLECGADPNMLDENGNNSVFFINNQKELELLKNYKADLNIINKYGYSPVLHFALRGDKEKVNLLISNGASAEIPNQKESLESCYSKYQTYHSWLKPGTRQTTFTGDFTYKDYGSNYERENLNYKTQLTVEKIDEIIHNAKSTDRGLIDAYNQLKLEERQIYKAINSLYVIFRHYNQLTKEDLNNIAKMNPAGSKIPLVGVLKQLNDTTFTNNFEEKLEQEIEKLRLNYNEIVDVYYSNNIKNMVRNYIQLNEYLTEGVEYVTYMDGTNPLREKILKNLKENKSSCLAKNLKCQTSINNLSAKYEAAYNKVLLFQKDKQERRTTKKVVMKFVTFGLS